MEGGGDVMPLDLYEHMVTDDASGGASPGVSSTSNQAFLMDNWVHQLYEQVLCFTLPSSLHPTTLAFFCCPFLYFKELHYTLTPCQTVTPSYTHATLSNYATATLVPKEFHLGFFPKTRIICYYFLHSSTWRNPPSKKSWNSCHISPHLP